MTDLLPHQELETPALVGLLADLLQKQGRLLATAESCTGGLVAAACTDRAGSSAWFERGFVTYSNAAKSELLGVDAALIAAHGAVSEPVARAMASGARQAIGVDAALAITGIAGPGGGTDAKPVGTVWIALDVQGTVEARRYLMIGDRAEIRHRSAQAALEMLRRRLIAPA
ncbi:MAG: cinA [Variovorax sp.]|nr:cinA [Variovorax sp.]